MTASGGGSTSVTLDAQGAVHIVNCDVSATSGSAATYGVRCQGASASVEIVDSTVTGGIAPKSVALYLVCPNTIAESRLVGGEGTGTGSSDDAYGLLSSSDSNLVGTTVLAPLAARRSVGIRLSSYLTTSVMRDVDVVGSTGTGGCAGVENAGTLRANRLHVGSCTGVGSSAGFIDLNAAKLLLANSIIEGPISTNNTTFGLYVGGGPSTILNSYINGGSSQSGASTFSVSGVAAASRYSSSTRFSRAAARCRRKRRCRSAVWWAPALPPSSITTCGGAR